MGGVAFKGSMSQLYAANLHSRVASRILVRLATFRAAHFSDLERGATRIPWERWLVPGSGVDLRVTCRKSRLYHSGAVAERIAGLLERKGLTARQEKEEDEAGEAGPSQQRLIVRLDRDECVMSIDSSGDLLHRRGYRKAVARAPLRETLAAAILLSSCSSDVATLVDPLCGSGTIPIEAARKVRRIPPGWDRGFAFQRWPDFDGKAWNDVKQAAGERILERAPEPIVGSDRDAGAIEASKANAERAGVAGDIEFVQRALSAVVAPKVDRGLLIVNPPYGERVSEGKELRDLYARLGDVARRHFSEWCIGILAADSKLVSQTRLPLTRRFSTTNGGIRVALWAMG